MGIFTRFKDIIGANINAMLDKAEDPELMIRLMIQEMEETLVELKSTCASIMADKKKVIREITVIEVDVEKWQQRAELAVEKGRDDLARDALLEKQRIEDSITSAQGQAAQYDQLISQSQEDITRLEKKIATAREKQRILIQRHRRANEKLRAERQIRHAGSYEAERKFDAFEQKIDRMEAESALVNTRESSQHQSLEDEFSRLEKDGSIEKELASLKKKFNREQ